MRKVYAYNKFDTLDIIDDDEHDESFFDEE
jgi:hypothetical protein